MVTSTPKPSRFPRLLKPNVLLATGIITILSCHGVIAGQVGDDWSRLPPPATFGATTVTAAATDLESRLRILESQNAQFARQQQTLIRDLKALSQRYDDLKQRTLGVGGYEDDVGAFVLVPGTTARPFELRADFYTEARYNNFSRNAEFFVDSTGTQQPIENVRAVEVTRNFIHFSGFALDPKLQFTAIVFSSTALNDTLYLGWINYRFSDALDIRIGNWVLPGTREWYESFRYTLGADRLMATTFFRPNTTPGVWAQGKLLDRVRYVAMWGNSSNRFSQGIERLGAPRAFSGTVWWESTGDFGRGPSDIEFHETPSLRLGASMTTSKEVNQGLGEIVGGNPEDTILRLSDGTPLFRNGALAPGVQLASTQYNLWAIDAAIKYRGMSLSGEYFFRLLNDFRTDSGTVPFDSLFDHGGLLQGGAFLKPGVELYARTSCVTGRFGSGYEYGGGANWYPKCSREWRFTFEVLQLNDSPAENILTGYRAGQSGTLYQLQWFVDF